MSDPRETVTCYTRELFDHLEEFFERATGFRSPTEFSTIDGFSDAVRAHATTIGPRGLDAFTYLDTEVRRFYARRGIAAFSASKRLAGVRLVLGGTSRFLESQLGSVSSAALLSDTVLVPDPVFPWLENERSEERFRHVLALQAVHTLLHLRPLVDADCAAPAVVVFPSFEKTLANHDEVTREGVKSLVVGVVSAAIARGYSELEEIVDFADSAPTEFLAALDASQLLVGPGGEPGESVTDALTRYDDNMRTWRSPEAQEAWFEMPLPSRALHGVIERLEPTFHLLENSFELNAEPLTALEVHAHYLGAVSRSAHHALERRGQLSAERVTAIDALRTRRLSWLHGIPISDLARLKADNQTTALRTRLDAAVARLSEKEVSDPDMVAAEVCHELDLVIADHNREMANLRRKYALKHQQTAAVSVGAAVAAAFPVLLPVVGGAAPFALALKYGFDKMHEHSERTALTRSLVGVLASSRSV